MNNNTVSSDLIRGHIDTIILRSLYFGDRYGYDIIKEIEQKTDGEYKLKQPTLYSCLKRLEDQGFTSSYWGAKSMGGRKKYYTLTELGRQLFIKNQTDWQRSRQIIERLIEGEEFESGDVRSAAFEKADADSRTSAGEYALNSEEGFGDDEILSSQGNLSNSNDLNNSDDLRNSDDLCVTEEAFAPLSGQSDGFDNNQTDNQTDKETVGGLLFNSILPPDETEKSDNLVPFDNFASSASAEETADEESEDEKRYDNFEAMYETDSEAFKHQEHYDNFSGYTPPPPEPYKPSIFIREETEEDVAARAAFESAQSSGADFTKSSYELDQSGEFIREFGLAADVNELEPQAATENLYFDQKDKPSYIDDVSGAEYAPRQTQKTTDNSFYACEDELPYAEHLLKEYGADISNTDNNADISNADNNADVNELSADRDNDLTENDDFDDSLASDVNELPYEPPYREAFRETDIESDEDPQKTPQDLSDVNELPPEITSENAYADDHEDDGVELPPSEPFKEKSKEDDLTKGFLKYDGSALGALKDDEIVERQYHAALSRLVREQKPRYSPDPFVQNKLEKTAANTAQMGDEMTIRKHTDTIKEYNTENYYFSNRLRLWQYGILFAIMLLETAITFTICEIFIHGAVITVTELCIYLFGVAACLALPALAFFKANSNLHKRKKAEYDSKSDLIFRILLCVLLILIIFFINSYLGIFSNKFSDYLATLIYPMVLTTNIVVSGFIFNKLYKSGKFK